MAQEINLGGTIYISSKHAAEKTGYTQDYIGQLARGGAVEAKRVSGMWYILEESLRNYKTKADQFVPTPPQSFTPNHEADVAVSFDGRDYVSANRAAKLTGYHQDYVGQLARSGHILSRQVGNRWYVDRESLLSHKKAKDDLLAAVQVESVGLAQPEPVVRESAKTSELATDDDEVTHFSYVKEEAPLIPKVESEESEPMPEFPRRKVAAPTFEEYRDNAHLEAAPEPIAIRRVEESVPESLTAAISVHKSEPEPVVYRDSIDEALAAEVNIPIRVMPQDVAAEAYSEGRSKREKKLKKGNLVFIAGISVAAALGTLAYIGSSLGFLDLSGIISMLPKAQNASVANSVVENGSSNAAEAIRDFFSKEIVYRRE